MDEHGKAMLHHLTQYLKHLTELNEETIRATLAATQGAAKDLPASAPSVPPPQVQNVSFECACSVWRKSECPHPDAPKAKSRTKVPKDPSNPEGPKSVLDFSDKCKAEYQKALKANKPKVPRKRASSTTAAAAANSGASSSKKQALTPVLDAAKEEDDEDAPEQYEEEEEEEEEEHKEEENGLDL